MGRRTLCTLPLSAELLKPEPPDPWTLWSETTRRKEASKAQYDKHQDRPSCHCHLVPMFTQTPRPSQRGTPWIYGQVVDNISPSSCSVDTGDLVLRRNRTELQPAAPPQNSPQQLPALSIPQPSLLGTPTISSDLSQRKLSQPPCHSPSSGMSALSAPPPPSTMPQQRVLETNTAPPNAVWPTSTMPQSTRSGRLIRMPKKFEDYSLY